MLKAKKRIVQRRVAEGKKIPQSISSQSVLQKIQSELDLNQSYISLILGLVIVLVAGVLVFNYFKANNSQLGPAQKIETPVVQQETQKDNPVTNTPSNKYTVKEGDTLYMIAQNFYKDGWKFDELGKANNLPNVNNIEVGQVLDIPAITPNPQIVAQVTGQASINSQTGYTQWGSTITEATYTVSEGDWLSKIAARAYGDVYAYDKIAQANNISNPDYIIPGTVLKIPRS